MTSARDAASRLARDARDLVVFGVRDLAYILRWPVVGHLARLVPDRYAHPPQPKDQVVLLLPGVLETWQFMRPIAEVLAAHGYPVRTVHYLRHNAGPIKEMALRAARFLVEQDLNDVVIVAHSKGGLIGKYVMARTTAGERVSAMVTLNAPFSGSAVAHWLPLRVVRPFHPRDATIAALNRRTDVNARITSISSRFDPLIRTHHALDGATAVELDAVGHFCVMTDPRLHRAILTVVGGGLLTHGSRI